MRVSGASARPLAGQSDVPYEDGVAGGVAVGASIVAVVAYCIGLHVLLVSGAWPTVALALIVAPWLFVAGPWLARLLRSGSTGRRGSIVLLALAATIVAAWSLLHASAWLDGHVDVVLYVENLVFFAWLAVLFGASLRDPESLVTRLARKVRRGDMPPAVVRYTYGVTLAWTVFFVAVMAISTLLFFTRSGATWSIFINLMLWPLVALLAVVEFLLRFVLLKDMTHPPFSAAIRAFRERSDDA